MATATAGGDGVHVSGAAIHTTADKEGLQGLREHTEDATGAGRSRVEV